MQTLIKFKDFVDEINSSNSRIFKQGVLEKWKEDVIILTYLQFAFNPYTVFGISTKKLSKPVGSMHGITGISSVFGLLEYLKVNNTGSDRVISLCQEFISNVSASDERAADLLEQLICKDFSIGCDAKTINSVIPGLIPTFSVQLAEKYFDKPERVEGKTFALTKKIDGGRIIAIRENGEVSFYTRAGQKYEGLVDLAAELFTTFPDGIVLDGEITLLANPLGLSSKDQYKQTMKITRKDGEKHGVKMLVFDILTVEEFKTQKCEHTYDERRQLLENLFGTTKRTYFELLPVLYRGKDTAEITKYLEELTSAGEEGVMINICDALYEFKRTTNLLKVKKMNTLDLEIVGVEEGEGRLAGTLGAIHVRYKDGNIVKVGSGFSDWHRNEIWQNQIYYIGKIVEIQYFEETKNDKGGVSLRFPIFKDIRLDKLTADY
jgi:DNA ligase-1